MATATAPAITREILFDRYSGALFVDGDEATEVYDKLIEDVGQVVEEAHAAIRALIVNRVDELGLAR